MLENNLIKIKKAEAEALEHIEAEEKKAETGLERTRVSLVEGKKKTLRKERDALAQEDGRLRKKIDIEAAGIRKHGKAEIDSLRKRVEGHVGDAAKKIFQEVLEELENA